MIQITFVLGSVLFHAPPAIEQHLSSKNGRSHTHNLATPMNLITLENVSKQFSERVLSLEHRLTAAA